MSRETGYYRVHDLDFRNKGLMYEGWGIVWFSADLGWSYVGHFLSSESFLKKFHVPEQVPVNPVPADFTRTVETVMYKSMADALGYYDDAEGESCW